MKLILLAALLLPVRALDLSKAVVVSSDPLPASFLVEEVERRTALRWPVSQTAPSGVPSIVLRRGAGPAEGFTIRTSAAGVEIAGNDARGLLYGVGRLLRDLNLEPGSAVLPQDLNLTTAPRYRIRGHQLGYRPKTNSYDGWTAAMWDQYIRDLVVFGINAIELIPPRSDDAPDSPHFPLPQMRMMIEMSRIAARYGLDVWVWYPALDADYSDPKTVAFALEEWAGVLKQLTRLDAVFVPGGDPGRTPPRHLMALLEKQTASIRRFHPKVQMWMSPQGFNAEWMKEFLAILNQEPAWLAGLVHGPQVRVTIDELRRLTPARYPIRNYPDITHATHCQFAVPDWDAAFAVTHAREPINPRPADMRAIFRATSPATAGAITYSEGCNDDVNKTVWSALLWDPEADLYATLRQYARYYVSPRFADSLALGLFDLENNWRGPLLANSSVESTLQRFQSLEKGAVPRQSGNWRLQMALYRAYYDAYVQRRLVHENAAEQAALDALRAGVPARAERILDEAAAQPPAPDLRARVLALAEALFQSARMQLSVGRYGAISRDRGATLDNLDVPLSNAAWIRIHLSEALAWTDPGPGGFYDDLGNPARSPHLLRPSSYEDDPAFTRLPRTGFTRNPFAAPAWRVSWLNHAETLYDAPLRMKYDGLDPAAQYKVRVVYGGEPGPARVMRLTAGSHELHAFRLIENVTQPVEFDIPAAATVSGSLTLEWTGQPGAGGNGRVCQVAEVWLLRH